MAKAFKVELDKRGCRLCKSGRTYAVVGPDDVHEATTFEDKQDAEYLAADLNSAYDRGYQAAAIDLIASGE